jgi:hypothetical protein
MMLFKDPGLKRFLRAQAHTWGVQNLMKLIELKEKTACKIENGKQNLK